MLHDRFQILDAASAAAICLRSFRKKEALPNINLETAAMVMGANIDRREMRDVAFAATDNPGSVTRGSRNDAMQARSPRLALDRCFGCATTGLGQGSIGQGSKSATRSKIIRIGRNGREIDVRQCGHGPLLGRNL